MIESKKDNVRAFGAVEMRQDQLEVYLADSC